MRLGIVTGFVAIGLALFTVPTVGQDTLPPTAPAASGRVAPEGPYRSRMRIVGEDEARPTADVDVALDALADDDYGRALLLRRLGYADAVRGDYAAAAERFEEALATDALDGLALAQIRQNLGALYVASGEFEKAVAALSPLMSGDMEPEPEALYALAYANARLERAADALAAVDRALADHDDPPTEWLELRLFAQSRLGNFPAAAETQVELLGRNPADEAGWRQLAGLYQAADRVDLAAAALLVAEAWGLLRDEAGIELIARTELAAGMPYQAAQRLEDALASGTLAPTADRYRLTADAWLLARESASAIEPLTQAANLSGATDLYLRLGDVHRENGNWALAARAYRTVTRRGGPQAARAWLGLGESRYRDGNVRGARAAFREASAYGGVYRAAADWLRFLGDGPAEEASDEGTLAAHATADEPPAGTDDADTSTDDATTEVALLTTPALEPVDVKQVPPGRYYLATESVTEDKALERALRLARDLRTAVNRQRISASGPLHVMLSSAEDRSLSLSVGVPVRSTAPPSGRFRAKRLDAFACAWTLYEGDWEGLPDAWRAFEQRVAASGRVPTGERRQIVFQRGRGDTASRVELQVGVEP